MKGFLEEANISPLISVKESIQLDTKLSLLDLAFKNIRDGAAGGRSGGINWEIGIDIYTLLYIE